MRKVLISLLLLLLSASACHKEEAELEKKPSTANARVACPAGYEYDDQVRKCVLLDLPYSPVRAYNTACRKLSQDPLFVDRIKANSTLTTRLLSAKYSMIEPKWNTLLAQANALVNSGSTDEVAIQAVLTKMGFPNPTEAEGFFILIYNNDLALKAKYPTIATVGAGKMYEQAHRYLINPQYVLEADRNPYTGLSGMPGGEMVTNDLQDPNPPPPPTNPAWYLYLPPR